MGQQLSNQTQNVIHNLPEKVVKHAALVRDSGFLTYEEFLGRVAELNDLTAKLASGQDKCLLFEVLPGSDSSALWKVVVRIVCTKINKTTGIVEASRILNLYQFIQLYKDITSQAAGILNTDLASEVILNTDSASEGTDGNLSSAASCQASIWMGRVKQLTDEEECCICMDGRADLILPCAHSFCQKCIDKWSDRNRNCPICRLQVTGTNDSWVVSDAPTKEDMASYILNLADEAGQPHRP
ncbi:RING finger protein 141 [Latimeria chalumnae]|uniref:RING finger protein 141 n=1 Tax=Latimeria chalumnae TaxID=7897 RepID=H3BFQ9_LATCH|nr:PREDICTED: RING finger protein 141 isoform X1 [Latimeria chalumnae]|eukprot:XP_005989755.1 PREDICTED: RING finger protein 141 isoform X1 [Latimeria chalumnae]